MGPKLCRQNSVEMQQAVEVIRPINLENKNSLLVPDSEDFQHNLVQSEKIQPKNTEQKLESPEKEDKHKEKLQTELTQHNIDIVTPYKILSNNLSKDSFWTNKHLIDDAEERFYSMRELVKVSIKEKEIKEDESDDDDDKKNNENHEDKRNFSTASNESFGKDGSDLPDLEHSDFTWTDESTYLNPKIPVLKPITFKMMSLNDSSQIETLVTKQAKSLTEQIKNDITYTFKDEKDSTSLTCTIQVSLESLQSSISQLEETLTTCTSEDLDSQYAVVQYVLKTVNGLETDAKKLEQTLSESRNQDIDFTTLSANLTGCKTQIITIQTSAENLKSKIERHQSDRRKKLNEFKRYQSLLIDLEQWVGEAQSAISTEINLTNVKVVRDQIRASEILQQELLMRAKQLKIMIEEVQQFMPFSEVEPLIIDMRENLGTLQQVLNEAQLTLESKLMNLQVVLHQLENESNDESFTSNDSLKDITIDFTKTEEKPFQIQIPNISSTEDSLLDVTNLQESSFATETTKHSVDITISVETPEDTLDTMAQDTEDKDVYIEEGASINITEIEMETQNTNQGEDDRSRSKSEWVDIKIVRLDKYESLTPVEITELSDEESVDETKLTVQGVVSTPSDDESYVETMDAEEIIHKPLSNESSIASNASVITIVENIEKDEPKRWSVNIPITRIDKTNNLEKSEKQDIVNIPIIRLDEELKGAKGVKGLKAFLQNEESKKSDNDSFKLTSTDEENDKEESENQPHLKLQSNNNKDIEGSESKDNKIHTNQDFDDTKEIDREQGKAGKIIENTNL